MHAGYIFYTGHFLLQDEDDDGDSNFSGDDDDDNDDKDNQGSDSSDSSEEGASIFCCTFIEPAGIARAE